VNPVSFICSTQLKKSGSSMTVCASTQWQSCRWLSLFAGFSHVQPVNDRDAFDFRVGCHTLYFAEYWFEIKFHVCWWTDYHEQQSVCSLHHPHLVFHDQCELLSLMCQFLINFVALLEIHICQVAFVLGTNFGIPLQHPVQCHYKNLTGNEYWRIQHLCTFPSSALLTTFDTM
jgi:hypothetical protein